MSASTKQQLQDTLDRFDRWVEANRDDCGQWHTPCNADGYFSFACYAIEQGRHFEAQRALRHIADAFVDDTGRLKQKANRDNMLAYVPAWIAWAAHETEMYDLAHKMTDQVLASQCPDTGGLFSSKQCDHISFDVTTIGLIALARNGRRDACAKAADYLIDLYNKQPDLNAGFVTEPPDAMLRWADPTQHYYKIGLFSLALTDTFGLLDEQRYLDTAVAVHDLTLERAADLWPNAASHKIIWSATAMYSVTGEERFLEHACRMCERLVEIQQPDGAFHYPEFWPQYPPEPWSFLPNIGAQFALWIARTVNRMA